MNKNFGAHFALQSSYSQAPNLEAKQSILNSTYFHFHILIAVVGLSCDLARDTRRQVLAAGGGLTTSDIDSTPGPT
jgi:hypothetical protein